MMLQGMQRGQGSPSAVRADSPQQAQRSSGEAAHARLWPWASRPPTLPCGPGKGLGFGFLNPTPSTRGLRVSETQLAPCCMGAWPGLTFSGWSRRSQPHSAGTAAGVQALKLRRLTRPHQRRPPVPGRPPLLHHAYRRLQQARLSHQPRPARSSSSSSSRRQPGSGQSSCRGAARRPRPHGATTSAWLAGAARLPGEAAALHGSRATGGSRDRPRPPQTSCSRALSDGVGRASVGGIALRQR